MAATTTTTTPANRRPNKQFWQRLGLNSIAAVAVVIAVVLTVVLAMASVEREGTPFATFGTEERVVLESDADNSFTEFRCDLDIDRDTLNLADGQVARTCGEVQDAWSGSFALGLFSLIILAIAILGVMFAFATTHRGRAFAFGIPSLVLVIAWVVVASFMNSDIDGRFFLHGVGASVICVIALSVMVLVSYFPRELDHS